MSSLLPVMFTSTDLRVRGGEKDVTATTRTHASASRDGEYVTVFEDDACPPPATVMVRAGGGRIRLRTHACMHKDKEDARIWGGSDLIVAGREDRIRGRRPMTAREQRRWMRERPGSDVEDAHSRVNASCGRTSRGGALGAREGVRGAIAGRCQERRSEASGRDIHRHPSNCKSSLQL
ncbi:hypothetical protein B0H17DRAFT_1130177 [Mycena rosella]|uniref:Uncharacterized protein n=1 Tax=Mycena rosella TaxID=1033263 RepID=A0AAD7GNW5_MYCRO|nr:hypothetical protein B0H17DRAFT_1130177 [Mycena rosella]